MKKFLQYIIKYYCWKSYQLPALGLLGDPKAGGFLLCFMVVVFRYILYYMGLESPTIGQNIYLWKVSTASFLEIAALMFIIL